MQMSPCSWGDIFTGPLRGDRIIGLRQKRKKVLITSTFEVYGKSQSLPSSEEDDLLIGLPDKGRWS